MARSGGSGTTLSDGFGHRIGALPDGGFLVAGEVQLAPTDFRGHVLVVSAGGDVTRRATFGRAGSSSFDALARLTDGSMVLGGATDAKGWLLDLDAGLGTRWESPLASVQRVRALAPLAGEDLALVATEDESTVAMGRTLLMACAPGGSSRWNVALPSAGRGELVALAALSDGLVAAGHREVKDGGAAKIWVVRVNPQGEVVWERTLGPDDETRRGAAIVTLGDGGAAVAGSALRNNRRGLRVARLAPDGRTVWEQSYGGADHDTAADLAPTGDGGLVLVGSTKSKGEGKTNAWVLRLDGDGKLLWDRAFGRA